MNYQTVKKQLGKELIVTAVVIALFGGLVFYIDTAADNYEHETANLEGEVNKITGEINNKKAQFSKAQKNAALYDEAMQRDSQNTLSLNRPLLRDAFNQFKSQYYLSNLRLSMAPSQEVTKKDKDITGSIDASDVEFSFDAITDEDIYGLLEAMPQLLPGSARINNFTLMRSAMPTDDILQTISQKGAYPLVKGTLKFTWFGLNLTKPTEETDLPSSDKAGQPK